MLFRPKAPLLPKVLPPKALLLRRRLPLSNRFEHVRAASIAGRSDLRTSGHVVLLGSMPLESSASQNPRRIAFTSGSRLDQQDLR
jgi:hypothetical protein